MGQEELLDTKYAETEAQAKYQAIAVASPFILSPPGAKRLGMLSIVPLE